MPSLNDLLMAKASLDVQIILTILHMILWQIIISYIFYPIVVWIISNLKCKKQFLHFNRESFKKLINWDIGDDEEEQVKIVSEWEAGMSQHFFGGMLCLPLAIGLDPMLPFGIATAMACHGSLSEIGSEIGDMVKRCYEIIFKGEEGRRKNPMNIMIILLMHHSCACCMVIPMNIFYRDNPYYAEISMLLQLAAFIAFVCQQYGFTLSMETHEGLRNMKISLSINLLIIIWSRVIRFAVLLQILLMTMWEDKNWFVLKFAVAPLICMTLFNVLVLMDSSMKFAKFMPMHIKKHSMDEIKDLAVEAASAGRHTRSRQSFSGMNLSQRNWAKIRGVVRMGIVQEPEKSKKME